MYYSHFRKIAARPASQYYSLMDTALVEILSFILSLSSATNLAFYIIFNFSNKQTRNLFSTSNVMMKLLTIINNGDDKDYNGGDDYCKIFIANHRFRYSLLYSVLGFFATALLEVKKRLLVGA